VLVDAGGGVSPIDAPASTRAAEARYADGWFNTITPKRSVKLAIALVAACEQRGRARADNRTAAPIRLGNEIPATAHRRAR